MTKQAVILAGGLGSRLGELTKSVAKPLLMVGGVPFVEHLSNNLKRFGFDEVILLCGYKSESFLPLTVPGKFPGLRIRLSVEVEDRLLGTGGALKNARTLLDETFLLLNGDTYFDFNLLDLVAKFGSSDFIGRLALRAIHSDGRYGCVTLQDERITEFLPSSEPGPIVINGGVYVLNRELVDEIPDQPCSLERDVFPEFAKRGRLSGYVYTGDFLDIGVPDDLARAPVFIETLARKPAAFLDRDGVLNVDHGYVHKIENITWVKGAKDAVKALNDQGYYVFVVTNQAGVARGYYTTEDVETLHRHMSDELRQVGAHIDAYEYCPHHPDGVVDAFRTHSRRRKPEPGMIEDLLLSWPIERDKSFLIGDRETDLQAAKAAGVTAHLFNTPRLDLFLEQILHA